MEVEDDNTADDNSSTISSLAAGKQICIVGECTLNKRIIEAANSFGLPVVFETSDADWQKYDSPTVFVLPEFRDCEKISKLGHSIFGPTALLELAEKKVPIPSIKRPLYSHAMDGLVVCFTGFREKSTLAKLMALVHNMGGHIRREMVSRVTHLIAHCCGGEKYQYALTFRVAIMNESWVHFAWSNRHTPFFSATAPEIVNEHKLQVFSGARICFVGFPEEEKNHMIEILEQNGGEPTDLNDSNCTHIVVDESRMDCLPPAASFRVHIVKAEWFWASVQNEGCVDEKEYLLEDHLENLTSPCATPNMSGLNTGSSSKRGARKRKRLRDCLVQTKDALSPTQYKRRSSISGRLSCGSLLDYTASPDSHLHDEVESSETPRKNLSARHQVFLELVQTESNYVNILNTIMTLFKSPLETLADSENELLNQTELKIIFGHLPPIHHTHTVMLEELRQLASCWKEESSVGNVFLKYSSELMKAYPPFINYFENMREMLLKCDQTKPRFHAFLKVCQTKPECGRQTLVELLIRPVQRLPSISLLLTDILKHTSKSNPDHCALEAALASIREVMTHINEDKRRTESQLAVFDIFNDIENCPPHLVSSHRSFISRCDVVELSDSLSGRGDSLAFFLFSDIVEVCKKRSKAFNTLKSPKEAGVKMNSGKMFKHVKLMHLSTLKRVIDINETDDCRKVFALMCRNNQELKEKLYSFAITDDSVDKMTFLRTLCRQMANTVCRADAENFLASLDPEQLDIETSDVSTGTLSKAFKFASRTRIKVGRAFSFNKTPSRLKRAMSTMMSPFVDSSQLS
nr:PREDICTED: protein ECT2-like isoform X2 [Bemisia tabaci]